MQVMHARLTNLVLSSLMISIQSCNQKDNLKSLDRLRSYQSKVTICPSMTRSVFQSCNWRLLREAPKSTNWTNFLKLNTVLMLTRSSNSVATSLNNLDLYAVLRRRTKDWKQAWRWPMNSTYLKNLRVRPWKRGVWVTLIWECLNR